MTFVATALGLSGCEMPEMLDGGVRTGEKVRFVAAVLPPHDVRRRSVGASHLEHFAIAVRPDWCRWMMTRSPMFACIAPSSFPCFMFMIYLVLPVRQSQRS